MPARFLLIAMLTIELGATTAAAYAQSEPPKGFLHCIGQTTNNEGTEHTIAIYSKTATMNSSEYDLYSNDTFYALQRDLPFSVLNWIEIIKINRVTGNYEISDGASVVQQIKIENGICTKMDRKL